MSIGLVIYFAEIATGLKVVAICISICCAFACIPCFVEARPTNRLQAAGWWCLGVAVFMASAAAIIPTTESAYKIAGVSAQEKGRIDALGNVKP